ncbi:N/A [soil metagenome]
MAEPVQIPVSGAPLARISRTVAPGTAPERLLDLFDGRPRGFWGRGDRWVAWGDALAEVTVAEPARERFARVRSETARLLGSHEFPAGLQGGVDGGGTDAPPRLFGGFSFLEKPEPNESWAAFPPARFVLPGAMLLGSPEGCTLVVQRFAGGDAEAEAEADRLEIALRDAVGAAGTSVPTEPLAPAGERSEERGEEAWTRGVEAVLAAEREARTDADANGGIVGAGLEKAVLARTRDVVLPDPVSIPRLLRFLRHENRQAHVFVFEPEPGSALFGAAPEVLADLRGGRFHATAVAGSAPRGRTTHEEQLFAGGLLASTKDRAEHRMTLEEMVSALRPRLRTLTVPDAPGVLTLARIQHLETPIHGEAATGEDILGLVEALHPTPAVCGRPREAALAMIREAEPFERGWYAGPVGWLDASGDGDFVPALRIGVGGGRRWRLYAGAGIVEGSDPHSEWEETALKFEPAHRALRAGMDR